MSCRSNIIELRLTLTSARTAYSLESLDPDAPLELSATLEYTGDAESVMLFHGKPLITIMLSSSRGTPVFNYCIDAILVQTTLRDQPLSFFSTGKLEYDALGGFPVGQYRVEAMIEYALEPGGDRVYETPGLSIGIE